MTFIVRAARLVPRAVPDALRLSAITHGMSHLLGHVAKGCLADLVLWKPEFFGTRAETVIKGGMIAWAQVRCSTRSRYDILTDAIQVGEANGSIPTVQPCYGRPQWGANPGGVAMNSIAWVSQAAVDKGTCDACALELWRLTADQISERNTASKSESRRSRIVATLARRI